MNKVTMDAVDSSNVMAIGYDAEAGEMHVQFRGGSTYIYENVPPDLSEEFKASPSKGSFYHERVKSQFKFRKAE